MKNLFKLILAAVVLFGAASCGLLGEEGNGGGNNGGGSSSSNFAISVTNITSTSATVSVTPLISGTYYFDVMDQSTVNSFSTLTSFAEAYIQYLKEYAASNGISFSDSLSAGRDSYTFSDMLEPGVKYYAFAFGVTSNGTLTSEVTVKSFTTLTSDSGNGSGNGSTSQNTFAISVSGITSDSATVSITPSNNDTYYFDVVETEFVEQYSSLKEMAADYIAYLKEYFESYGYTLADALSSGSDSYTYEGDLDPSTSYYAFVFGVNGDGTITTDVTVKSFSTAASSSTGGGSTSQNTFNVSVSNVTSDSATVSVVPSNNDTYYYDVYEADVVNQYGDINTFAADYIAYIIDYISGSGYSIADLLSSGSDSYTYEGILTPSTAYYAFAFGVNASGAVTTKVSYKTFTTSAAGSTGGGSTTGGLNITNLAMGGCTNYGDFYEIGATNYWIELYTADYSEALVLEIQTSLSATSCVGTYPFNLTFEAGSAISGFVYNQYLYGSYWAALTSDGGVSSYAMIDSGSVSISKSGDNYVITVDAATDEGETITASYNGVLEESVDTYSVMSVGSKRKSFRITSVNSFKKLGGRNIMLQPIHKKFASVPAVAPAPAKISIKKKVNLEAKAPQLTIYKALKK